MLLVSRCHALGLLRCAAIPRFCRRAVGKAHDSFLEQTPIQQARAHQLYAATSRGVSLPGDSWRSLLQTFRTKIFLCLSDDFSAKTASEFCGREDRLKVSYNLSESGHDARVSLLTGKAVSHRANITASKSYNTQSDYRFDMKTFMELRNAQAIALAYDGLNPKPPMFCYLKPYYNDPDQSYFKQLAEGVL